MCTANQCRSPMAEALLRSRLARRGIDGRVSSAGVMAGGTPASPPAVRAMADRGLDIGRHRGRQVTAELAAGADLVITMERRHARAVVAACPDAAPRVFTLKELARRAVAAGPRPVGQPLAAWLAAVGRGRSPADLLAPGDDDDVADPIGGPDPGYRLTATEIDELLGRVVELAFPDHQPSEPSRAPAGPGRLEQP